MTRVVVAHGKTVGQWKPNALNMDTLVWRSLNLVANPAWFELAWRSLYSATSQTGGAYGFVPGLEVCLSSLTYPSGLVKLAKNQHILHRILKWARRRSNGQNWRCLELLMSRGISAYGAWAPRRGKCQCGERPWDELPVTCPIVGKPGK